MAVDRVRLDLTVPLIEAVSASDREAWFEAADLWFYVARDPRCRALAAPCGLEAALDAGLFDLAEYFRVLLAELPETPDFVAHLYDRYASVREARRRHYMRGLDATGSRDNATAQELLRLRLFADAIRVLYTGEPWRADPAAAAPILARAYERMGAHDAFVAIAEAWKADIADPDLPVRVERASQLQARRADPPGAILARFEAGHPAGHHLPALLEPGDDGGAAEPVAT